MAVGVGPGRTLGPKQPTSDSTGAPCLSNCDDFVPGTCICQSSGTLFPFSTQTPCRVGHGAHGRHTMAYVTNGSTNYLLLWTIDDTIHSLSKMTDKGENQNVPKS